MKISALKKIAALAFVLLSCHFYGFSSPVTGIDDAASVAVYVKDLRTGKMLADYQSAKALTPASVMKSLTVATALRTLGAEYRFETPVYFIGHRRGDLFSGRVVVAASGDPTIDSRYFSEKAGFTDSIAEMLVKNGIKRLRGDIEVEQSRFKDCGPSLRWEIEDVAWEYGAAFHGFNYADNLVSLDLESLKTDPRLVKFNVARGEKKGKFELVRGINSTELRVDGAFGKRSSVLTTVPDPSAVFKVKMMSALEDAGIVYEAGRAGDAGDTIAVYRHLSPTAAEISRSLMCRSDNMMADAMLRAVSDEKTLAASLAVEKALWDSLGVSLKSTRILDGSGLARANALPARVLGEILADMSGDTAYVSAFPLVGFDGTVKNFLRDTPLEGRMALKSGSMTGVRCYAGYKLDGEGRPTHAVVLMVNNSFLKAAELRKTLERYLLALFR